MESSPRTFENSLIKQARRLDIFGCFVGRHKDFTKRICVLSLPGPKALEDEQSLECMLLEKYSDTKFVFIERNKDAADLIAEQCENLPGWKKTSTRLYRGESFSVVRDLADLAAVEDSRIPAFDLIHLDWMGSYGWEEDFTVKTILRNRLLKPDGVLALTVGALGRSRGKNEETFSKSGLPEWEDLKNKTLDHQTTAFLIQRLLLSLGTKFGYQFSPKSFATPYSCDDESSKAVPMVSAVMFGGKRISRSAYGPAVGPSE